MKILKRVAPPPPWSKKVTCSHCKSELEIQRSDVSSRAVQYYSEDVYHCPVCTTENKV